MIASMIASTLARLVLLAAVFALLPDAARAEPPAPLAPVPKGPAALPPAPDADRRKTQVLLLGWTAIDSQHAASALVAAVAASPWVARFNREKKRAPRVRLRGVRNRTGGHLSTRQLERLVEAKITASIRLKLAAPGLAGKLSEDVILDVWMLGQNDRSGGTMLDSTLVSLVGRDVTSGYEVVRALFERRKLIVMPPTTGHTVPGRPPPPPGQPKITFLRPDQPVDLSGLFNDVDARALSRSALQDALKSGWLTKAKTRPIVKLYGIRNRTTEHVQRQVISERLAAGLLASGRVRLPGGRTRAALDPKNTYVLSGSLTSQVSALSVTQTLRVYRLHLQAVNVDSNRQVWVSTQSLKKIVATPKAQPDAKRSTSW